MPDVPTNNGSTTSGTADSGTPTSGISSSATQGESAPQEPDDTQDTDNDEVTLKRVRTAVEQYNNGELAYEELLERPPVGLTLRSGGSHVIDGNRQAAAGVSAAVQ